MASGYTPTNETGNFGKFARIILDLCRDAVFQILAKEIPPADLPNKIRANLHKLSNLSPEQLNKIPSKPAGISPCSTDFDVSVLYTLIRNICPGIFRPAQGWGYPPQPSDTHVSDDVERIRQKRNALFGHAYTAALSDTDFNNEFAEMRQIISRLDNYLGQNFLAGLYAIERGSMDPDMQMRYSERCQLLLEQDRETREQLTSLKDQQVGAQIRQEETIEMVQELRNKQTMGQLRQDEAIEMLYELQDTHTADRLRQDKAICSLLESHDEQTAGQLRQEEAIEKLQGTVTGIQRKVDALSRKDDQTLAERWKDADEATLQRQTCEMYEGDMFLQVTTIPTYGDVPVSEVFTPIIIREDLETAFNLESRKSGENRSAFICQNCQTKKKVQSYKDMFYKDSQFQNNVYLLGQAGSGKTTFCRHLLDVWCKKSAGTAQYETPEVIYNFDFVFLVFCRDADASHKVMDMILEQLFPGPDNEYQSLVRHVLRTKPEKCLIIIDGLDEWAGSPSRSTGSRTPLGLPDRRGLENCVFFTTSRPWRIEGLRQGAGRSYRMLEIQGLTDSDIQTIATKIIKAEEESKSDENVKALVNDFTSCVTKAKLGAVVETPLMLLNVFALWHDCKSLDISVCVNYSQMIESLLIRGEGKSDRSYAHNRLTDRTNLLSRHERPKLPQCFDSLASSQLYAVLIHKLARLAFERLFHTEKERSLVFSMPDLEKYFLKSEIAAILNIGLFSLSAAHSKSRKRLAMVSFLHKTVQEFLAAVWMAGASCTDCFSVFTKHCKCVTDIHGYSVFLVFLCGLSHDKGREVWRYIAELTTSDQAVLEYRATILDPHTDLFVYPSDPVPRLQQLLLQCTAEAMHHRPDMPLNYNIQDVYVGREISVENLDLLLRHAVGIKTLVMSDMEPSPNLLEAINRMVSLECLVIHALRHSDPKQFFAIIWTAVNSLSPVKSLKLREMSIAAPNRLFTVQLPQMLKSLTLRKVSITGRMQVSWPVTMETLHMHDATLDHDSVLQLATRLQGSSSLQQLCFEELKCRDCGDSCQYELDITSHTRLQRLKLRDLRLDRVSVTPSNLETVELGYLQKPGAAGSVISCLYFAPQLTELSIYWCELSHDDISTMCSVLPRLSQLGRLRLDGIHCDDLAVCVSPDMCQLKEIMLECVTMSNQAWSKFACSLPPTSHQLTVKLVYVTMSDQACSNFARSLPRTPHHLTVQLIGVNIDAATRSYIAAHFTVTRDVGPSSCGRRTLYFHCGEQT